MDLNSPKWPEVPTLREYPFIFIDQQFGLASAAATAVAFDLWRLNYYQLYYFPFNADVFLFLKKEFSCKDYFDIPRPLRKMIDVKIPLIKKHLKNWINFHSKAKIFDGDFETVFPRCFRHIVAGPNGKINYKQTATNLIYDTDDRDAFSNVEKYKLATFYCLEDCIKLIWPLVSHDPSVIAAECGLMYYWNRRMRSRKDTESLASRFRASFYDKNYAAFEYFFDQFPSKTKISTVSAMFNPVYQAQKFNHEYRLLRRLNVDEARKVFEKHGWRLLSFLINDEYYFWYHVHDVRMVMEPAILANWRMFFEILRRLWYAVFGCSNLDLEERVELNKIIAEMWASAGDDLKSYISHNHIHQFYSMDMYSFCYGDFPQFYGLNMTFMVELFGLASYEVRNHMWLKHWRKLAVRARPQQLVQIMKLCLPDNEAVEKFAEEYFVKHSLIYKFFITAGRYWDFGVFLRYFCKGQKSRRTLVNRAYKFYKDEKGELDMDGFCKLLEFSSEMIFGPRSGRK